MKKFTAVISFILCAILAVTLVACGGNSTPPDSNVPDTDRPIYDGTKTLVVYFSQPDNVDDSTVVIDGETLGNTQYMAYVIQENTGANIFRIIPETPYPTDHEELVDLASDEKAENARPAISGSIENFDVYETVFVGYPNWWGDMPMILYTFFDTYDFSGKTIIPFNTHGGSGFSSTISTIHTLEPNATVDNGLSISRNRIQDAEQQIIDWVVGLGFEKSETPDETPDEMPEEPTESLTYERIGNGYAVKEETENVENIVIPAQYEGLPVTVIGESAFAYSRHNSDILSVTIPDSVTTIERNAFYNRSELVTVNIGENSELTTIGNNAFSGNSSLTSIYLPSGVTSIGNSAFNNCGGLERITVSESNTAYSSDGNALIEMATNTLIRGTNNTVIAPSVTAIAQAAFRRSTIATINIPASVNEIGNYAFSDCAGLTAITVSAENANFAAMDGILYNKTMTSIVCVPAGVAGDIVLPDTLTELPNSAFDGRTALTSVYIPNTLTRIRLNSFRNTNLTIRYGGTEAQWGEVEINSNWGGVALTVVFGATINPDVTPDENANGILVIYFSASGNTERVANHIAQATSGELFELIPVNPYTDADLNYGNANSRVSREHNDESLRNIELVASTVENWDEYDTVFIGYPIWWQIAAWPVNNFILDNDFTGKTVIPFATSASSGLGQSGKLLAEMAGEGNWLEGQRFSSSASQNTVESWLTGLGNIS